MRRAGGCADETPLQTPCRAPAASTQARHAIVPLLWQGSSPFEYRGLETESDDEETPRGLPAAVAAAHATMSTDAQHQVPMQSVPALQSHGSAPPLLKRNMAKGAHSKVLICRQCQIHWCCLRLGCIPCIFICGS